MNEKINLAFFVLFTAFSVNAQMATFKKELVRPAQLSYYAINHLGDTSSIVSNEIAKEALLRTYTFKDPFLGAIHWYDERNPLQQLVFYKNTQRIVLLDNQLSVKDKIVLMDRYPELDAVFVSLTAQGSIWIFDGATKRWCIISEQTDQPQFVSNPIPSVDFVTTSGNFAYWQVNQNIYGMDVYGKIVQEEKLPSKAKLLAINGKHFVYQLNNGVFLLDTENKETERLREVTFEIERAFFNAKTISLLSKDKLYLYNIN